MRAASPPKLFDSDPEKKLLAPIPFEFEITNRVIDVGRRVQGEIIEGRIPFRAPRRDIVVVRPLQAISGLSIGSAIWTGPSEGYLPYQWQTTLLWQNVDQIITLEAVASSALRASADAQFRARIDGKVAFKQVPETIDPRQAGQVELQIQNLAAKPLKVLSVASHNRAYIIDDDVPETIDPGKSGRVLIRYAAQAEPVGASLALQLSEILGPSPTTTIPLNVKLAEEKRPATYTREELDRIIRKP
ncbi:MAG: hypothetical protein HY646_19380 [Acidobacteria bacterium]|nr:hypothetical protein [Acidobacteriota bacterium]